MSIDTPSRLTDAALDAEVKRLAACERTVTVELIVHLAELDRRRLYLGYGFSSMFTYCRHALALSEQAAYHRIVAARAVRRHPVIVGMLADGALNLSTLRLLAPHLTGENHAELLDAAKGASKRQVEELVAARFPQAERPPLIRKLAAPRADADAPKMIEVGPAPMPPPLPQSTPVVKPIAAPPRAGAVPVTPRAEDRYEFRFTGTRELRDKVDTARDLLRHAVPSGDLAEIMNRAVTALLAELARKKFSAALDPRASRGTAPGSRDVPAGVEREVWTRDGGRCAFVSASGRRCEATAFLEFHHLHPYGAGGPATIGNIALRCQAHNLYEAETFYGRRDGYSPRGEFRVHP